MSDARTLERAYAELERSLAVARAQAAQFSGPCETCRYFAQNIAPVIVVNWVMSEQCSHPLAGRFVFDKAHHSERFMPFKMKDRYAQPRRREPEVCGPNHILWEPKLTLWQRAKAFFERS